MKIVSLFDGIGCGLVALKRAGIKVSEYHAFEIDKYAIKVALKNHPEIIQHGSVVDFSFSLLRGADLVIGGSPCQGFSNLGNKEGFQDSRSSLFYIYLQALADINPKHFLLENVRMKQEWMDKISGLLGVSPHPINSALVSAQQRPRNYWYNWTKPLITDRGIVFKDIQQVKDTTPNSAAWHEWFHKNKDYQLRKGFSKVLLPDSKTLCLTSRSVASWCASIVPVGKDLYRFLTPIETERCQTLPDDYTLGIPVAQRYRSLGNGWTVDVLVEIFRHMNTPRLPEYDYS